VRKDKEFPVINVVILVTAESTQRSKGQNCVFSAVIEADFLLGDFADFCVRKFCATSCLARCNKYKE